MPLRTRDIVLDSQTADPSVEDGKVWYNSTDGDIRGRAGGLTVSLTAGASFISEATGNITTTSGTDVIATDMTLTPAAGMYLVWFSSSVKGSSSGNNTFVSVHIDGVQVAASERFIAGNTETPFCCLARITVNGSEQIEGRWRVSAGTGTMNQRSLAVLRAS